MTSKGDDMVALYLCAEVVLYLASDESRFLIASLGGGERERGGEGGKVVTRNRRGLHEIGSRLALEGERKVTPNAGVPIGYDSEAVEKGKWKGTERES